MTFLVPDSDHRKYRDIVLDNGLQVIIAHDDNTNCAAAALTVAVGQFHDPPEVQGLAHFCEHMLFLGTEKYPELSGYDEFCASAAGYSNAYTGMNSTTYHWLVTYDHMKEALDRFASFFVCPLFTAEATEREMMAVDSEHSKNLQDDGNRMLQLERSTAHKGHPFNMFGTGCYATLHDMPIQQGTDVRNHLLAFHAAYYAARGMRLCVLGRDSLDDMEAWVREFFTAIPDHPVDYPVVPSQRDAIFGPEWFDIYKIVPVKEKRLVTLLWPMGSTYPLYRLKPHRLLSFTMGHEGKGSVLHALKRRGWAFELMAGCSTLTKEFSIFICHIGLTKEGLANYREVVALVYGYINILRHAPQAELKRVFDEVKALGELNFRFKKVEREDDFTDEISNNMFKFPLEHAISGPHVFLDEFDHDAIQEVAADLNCGNMRIHLVAPEEELVPTLPQTPQMLEEEWYKTRYARVVKPIDWVTEWSNSSSSSYPELSLPHTNKFIATDVSIRTCEGAPPHPTLVVDEPGLKAWHAFDVSFRAPQTAVIVGLTTPLAKASAWSAGLTRMTLEVFEETANEITYDASEAGLEFRITNTSSTSTCIGLRLVSHGFSQKMPHLIHAVLKKLIHLEVTDDVFQLIKHKTVEDYRNRRFQQPYYHAVNAKNQFEQHPMYTDAMRLEQVEKMTADDLRAFIPEFFSSVLVECVVIGNLTADEAREFVHKAIEFTEMWKSPPPTPLFRVTKMETGKVYRRIAPVLNEQEDNSAVVMFLQVGGQTTQEDVLLELFVQLIDQFAYSQLRTVEQLGYVVSTQATRLSRVQGLVIVCQSTRSPHYVEERIENCLRTFRSDLASMPEEMVKQHCDSLAQKKLSPHRSLDTKCETLLQRSEIARTNGIACSTRQRRCVDSY